MGRFVPVLRSIPWLAAAAMLLALVGNLYPVPEGPYGKLPYIYLAYLIAGLGWFRFVREQEEGRTQTWNRQNRTP